MKQSTKTVVLMLAILITPALAFAASPWAGQGTYTEQVKGKLDFGLKNLLGGWTELLTEPIEAENDAASTIKSFGKGIYNAVVYTLGGALHTATFAVPQIDIPIPDNGVSF